MTDIIPNLEKYIRDTGLPNPNSFKNNNIRLVKDYIVRFETAKEAEGHLQDAFTVAYCNVKPSSSRSGGTLIIDVLFEEAKTENVIRVESLRILRAGVTRASSQLKRNEVTI
ncbi:hypothetical protein HPULCUR_000248 [Helicostylum pulchrum]|uniref:Uncharacterized protein n=1 Tax=Helicostylum pulchrum TaxID=562976 RepID=A0ABP9XL20_9FUNG